MGSGNSRLRDEWRGYDTATTWCLLQHSGPCWTLTTMALTFSSAPSIFSARRFRLCPGLNSMGRTSSDSFRLLKSISLTLYARVCISRTHAHAVLITLRRPQSISTNSSDQALRIASASNGEAFNIVTNYLCPSKAIFLRCIRAHRVSVLLAWCHVILYSPSTQQLSSFSLRLLAGRMHLQSG